LRNTANILITANDSGDFNNILDSLNNQNGLNIIGVESNEANTIIKSERFKPDVLILDLTQSVMDGTELAPIIHRRSPNTGIIMICDRDENDYAGTALKAGISGFLLKKTDMNKLLHAVRIVNMGGYYISSSIIRRALDSITVINQFPGKSNVNKGENCLLSPVERCIVVELAQGLSDKEIAVRLNYSAGSIRNCVTSIKRKTKLKNRVEIVVFSLVCGLIDIEQLDFTVKKE
jgi:DNA-binding NarL/FixJ family response regulator